jgi:hypothetical protein
MNSSIPFEIAMTDPTKPSPVKSDFSINPRLLEGGTEAYGNAQVTFTEAEKAAYAERSEEAAVQALLSEKTPKTALFTPEECRASTETVELQIAGKMLADRLKNQRKEGQVEPVADAPKKPAV